MKRTVTFIAGSALSLVMIASCAKKETTATTDSAAATTATAAPNNLEANKAGVRAFYEVVINGHHVDSLGNYCAANFVDHNPDPGHTGQGLDDIKKEFTEWFASMPDAHVTTEQMIAEGDLVSSITTMTGTMKGDMGPMKATNKACKVMGIDIVRLKDGKAVERWGLIDQMAMMQQMGMMPPPPGAPAGKK